MAQVEPMDIDSIESDFDNKENAFQHNNVLSKTPCTEKGYEELDVSELNMKLRYSITPASSPMTKSLTGLCSDNRNCTSEDHPNSVVGIENGNLTRSLNTTLNKNDSLNKTKVLPLQTLSKDSFIDSNRNSSVRRLLDPSDNNVIIISSENDNDENLSVPSTCSSVPDTPEATTPTKEVPKPEGSPILRGLKSVLSMFRPSQSPIPSAEEKSMKQENFSCNEFHTPEIQTMQVSTPIASRQREESLSKRTSPLKESLVFNDDLEKELQWKNDSSVVFKGERAPVHKLFFNNPITFSKAIAQPVNPTVESMDISCNETILGDQTMTDITINVQSDKIEPSIGVESDNEFLDCENTFAKDESYVIDHKQLDIVSETHVTGNKIVDVPQQTDITREIERENKNILNNTICIEPEAISVASEQTSVSGTDFKNNTLDWNNVNIIDATKNFLNIENIYNSEIATSDRTVFKDHKIEVKQESQVGNKLKLQNNTMDETLSINEHVLGDNEAITTEIKHPTIIKVEHDIVTCENLENNSVNHPISTQEVCDNIDVCLEKLNNIEILQVNCIDCLDTIEASGNIGSVEDVSVNVKDIDLSSNINVDDQIKVIQSVDIIGSTPIIEEPSVTNKTIGSTPTFSMDPNINELNNGEDIPISNKSINVASISNVVTPIFNENYDVTDVPIANISKNKDKLLIGNEIHTNLESSQNFIVAQTDLYDVLNVPNIDLISTLPETNITNNINHGSLEQIKVSTTLNSPQTNLEEDMKSLKYDETQIICPLSNKFSSLVNSVSDNDRDIPELTISNQMSSTNLPPEVPVPIENEIEHNYMLSNNACNKEHIIECNEINPTAVIEDKIISICIEHDNATKLPNFIDTAMEVENDEIEKVVKEAVVGENLNATETCITQSTHVEMTEIVNTSSKDEVISNLQIVDEISLPEENVSNDMTKQDEEVNMKDVQNVLEIQSNENNLINGKPTSNSIGNVVNMDNEISSIILANSENTEKPNNNASEKLEETSVVKTVEQQNFTPEKELDEVDEEIVTSANNSPYVSVSDLTIDVNNVVKELLDETNNPFVTGNKLAASPPISPKIISKGYNFNFDEIDDPFATKTKIRMSPTPDTLNLSSGTVTEDTKKMPLKVPKQNNNRRKSQPERKRAVQKKNSSFTPNLKKADSKHEQHLESNLSSSKDFVLDNITTSVKNNISEGKSEIHNTTTSQNAVVSQQVNAASEIVEINATQKSSSVEGKEPHNKAEEINSLEQTLIISSEKSTSSSEQYFSLGTSLGDSNSNSNGLKNQSKNVFNLPEIDDVNFNPFATKSNMRMSPLPFETAGLSDLSKQTDKNNIASNKDTDITYNKSITQDSSHDSTSATCSSTNTNDIDRTIKEIATEDEDTVEGPFLDSDEFKDIEKLSNIENETCMINFHEAPKVEKDENQENGELFIDADAFEFLLNQNKSTTVSDSGKESLFLKFDPLFAKRVSSDGFLAALSKVNKRQSTPKKVAKVVPKDLPSIDKSEAGPSNRNDGCGPVEEYSEDPSSNVTKPMMVVNPAVSSLITQKKPATPKLNRRSLTFTSPAMAVIDRLLSLSGNASFQENDTSISHGFRERTETDLAITQLRELLAEKEINVHNLRSESKELKARLAALEVQVRGLETESAERLARINDLNDRLLEKTKMNKSMATVVEEYERTIASLIAETEQDKKHNAEERRSLIKERDEQTAHLTSMEVSFSDLHSKYEKSKQIILRCKANEDIYRKSIQEFQDNFSKMQNNYELLKQHATSKLNHANQELEKMNRTHEAEVLKLNALLKRKELHITSLEETLAQKTKANEELTAICDELINKVG